ncbi:hypothetical protein F9L16_07465 [Agarivorans sp. B2Z047]|uniref:hypothetical protein n=1 Tax=Agarivorans sp. B2Z047 TaxID=2652721 RepID=UPI00128E311F|nr:hypothetical protein [Agarivorans sp. B2Z047]MPW28844.1 hypothetical protein [Agarivorans sp. B2Z047]UQN41404.1 hypothetical protein LQZ07_16670 [Agarivorans sp. B2Z047]
MSGPTKCGFKQGYLFAFHPELKASLIIKLLFAVSALLLLSACEPKGGVDLRSKCSSNCDRNGNNGHIPAPPKGATLTTAGIYRDQANDHVATIDQNGRVLFWDDYSQDRELEQRALVQRVVSLETAYLENKSCMLAYNGSLSDHHYSFSQEDSNLLFSSSCGDVRFYRKALSPSPKTSTQMFSDSPQMLFHISGESLELSQTFVSNIEGEKAELSANGFLSLPAPNNHCVQEFLIDHLALILLSSPNCQDTGFESGIYSY